MDKLYRLVQADGMSFESYGSRVGIRVNAPESLDLIRKYLPPGWKSCSSVVVDRLYSFLLARGPGRPGLRRFHTAYAGMQNLARSQRAEDLFAAFESDLNSYVAQRSPEYCFVHAGVVAWQGSAIVIPGPSYSGKTTLTQEFLRCGATYYSDEFAVFDRSGRVHPFARALGVRDREGRNEGRIVPAAVGASVGNKALQVAMVLVTQFQPSACWRPTRISPAQGALALLANAVSARKRPASTLSMLERVVRTASILRGKRGEARQLVERVLDEWKGDRLSGAA
jgi:hypothetical protein